MKGILIRLFKEEEGQDLTEYALLLTLIALVAIASVNTLSAAIQASFTGASTNMT